jgi:starch phosphorylase
VDELWRTPDKWNAMAIHNTARMGWFSSDRAIRQYAKDIWNVPTA